MMTTTTGRATVDNNTPTERRTHNLGNARLAVSTRARQAIDMMTMDGQEAQTTEYNDGEPPHRSTTTNHREQLNHTNTTRNTTAHSAKQSDGTS
eukprot:7814305-Prorocentrum_lima.AAC.1